MENKIPIIKKMKPSYQKFSIYDLMIISIMAAIGIAIKPIVVPIAHIVGSAIMIPGGPMAGGLYMMWLVLGFSITGKYFTSSMIGLVQAIIVMFLGLPGSHGVFSLITYTMPGVSIDLLMFILLSLFKCDFNNVISICAGTIANITGTFFVNMVLLHLPFGFLLLTLTVSAVSGGIGGLLSWELFEALSKTRIVRRKRPVNHSQTNKHSQTENLIKKRRTVIKK